MTLRTITFDDEHWQVVPKQMTEPMRDRFHEDIRILCDPLERTANIRNDLYVWSQVLAAAPEPPAQPRKAQSRDTMSEYGVIPMQDQVSEPPAQQLLTDAAADVLAEALAAVTATLEWQAHGICRATDGPILNSADAVAMGKAALATAQRRNQ